MKNKVKRITAILLSVVLLMSIVPFAAFADFKWSKKYGSTSGTIVNPIFESYSKKTSELNLNKNSTVFNNGISIEKDMAEYNSLPTYYGSDIEELAIYIKKQMNARKKSFSFYFQYRYTEDYIDRLHELMQHAFVFVFEDDYLYGNTIDCTYYGEDGVQVDSTDIQYTITIESTYLTTAEEEKQVDAAVKRIAASINKSGSDYDKILQIYKYLCKNVSYNYDAFETDEYYASHSAYYALCKKRAIGLGYALSFLRIARAIGLDSNISGGIFTDGTSEMEHHWNVAKIGSRYYNLDASMDSGLTDNFQFFLHSYNSFANHQTADLFKERHDQIWGMWDEDYYRRNVRGAKKYVPDAPELTADFDSDGNIHLSWDNKSSKMITISEYAVYVSEYDDMGCDDYYRYYYSDNNNEIVKEITYTNIKPGKTYYFRVCGFDKSGYKTDSSKMVTVNCVPNVSVINDVSTGKPKLEWNVIKDVTQYQVYRSTTGEADSYSRIRTTTSTSFTNTSAVTGQKYYYKVRALNPDKNITTGFSKVIAITCDLPQPVVTVSCNPTSGKPVISWDEVEGADKYQLYCSTTGKDNSYTRIATVTGTTVTNSSAVAGTKYYYKVRAVYSANSLANSSFSKAKAIVCDLKAPELTVALNANGKPTLNWTAIDGAVKYEVCRKTGIDGSYERLSYVAGTTATNSSAEVGTTYYYKVRAIYSNTLANSAYSTEITITT